MSTDPFLVLKVRGKKDVLALRQKARRVAQLLRFEPYEQTCIAAGAFAVAQQAVGQMGGVRICFQLDRDQLHIYVQGVIDETASPRGETVKPLLRLARPLPAEKGLEEMDVSWLVQRLDLPAPSGLYEEIIKQNQEVLSLLHELQLCRGYLRPKEEAAANPHAA
jgi:hypothetical protein